MQTAVIEESLENKGEIRVRGQPAENTLGGKKGAFLLIRVVEGIFRDPIKGFLRAELKRDLVRTGRTNDFTL